VLELEADGIGLALAPGPSGARRSAGAPARDLEAAIATAVLERPHVPDLLIGSALCSVSIDVVDDSTLEESVCAEIVGSTAEFGVSCVIPGRLHRARRRLPAAAHGRTGDHPAGTPRALM